VETNYNFFYKYEVIFQVRFDLEDFSLASDADGQCKVDGLTVLNSSGGAGGRICGLKTGYAFVAKTSGEGDLGLAVVVQSPSYKWNIKITQIPCDKVNMS
jgi:hypothetical protein